MGDINNRNLQLKLAFQDEDMRKPAHDKIMHWLDVWVKETKNIAPFLKREVTPRKGGDSVDSVSKLPEPCAAPAGEGKDSAPLRREPKGRPGDTMVPAP